MCSKKRELISDVIDKMDWWQSDAMASLCIKALKANIEVEFVQELIKKLDLSPDHHAIDLENWPWPVKIYTLGRFSLVVNGKPIQFNGKVQKRPLDLLKALISLGGRDVNKDTLIEMLWPDSEGDDAHKSFTVTLHRLRKLIGIDIIQLQQGQLSLLPHLCWVDNWAFSRHLSCACDDLAHNRLDDSWRMTERALALYKGELLGRELPCWWMLSLRENLRRKLLYHINTICLQLYQQNHYQQAINGYLKGLEVDDLQEGFYRGLIICYLGLGQFSDAMLTYQRCREMLTAVLGIEPSSETTKLVSNLVQ